MTREPVQAVLRNGTEPDPKDLVFSLATRKSTFRQAEAYEIAYQEREGEPREINIAGASAQATLYAVFDFLERQGAFFGLDGEVYPLEPVRRINLPPAGMPWKAEPRFSVRGLNPWPNFLNCIGAFNREDHRAYLEAMLRMRLNTLGIHVFAQSKGYAESFLSFEYGGVGHLAFTDTTATSRWGYLPQRTSQYGMGAADFYQDEVFGAEATTQAHNCWEDTSYAKQLWSEAFRYAQQLGIRTGLGFEPYQIPDEIYNAVPPEARYVPKDPNMPGPRLDPESVAARDILEVRLGSLLEAYPMVDYVWLWEQESMNSVRALKANVPLSVTPFKQAADFLRRHAPKKRLVISGWGGVVRRYAAFHQQLPGDVIFSSLSGNLGWDPVSEKYAELDGRERWAIPWLEDDAAMWIPQFRVHRFVADMDRAEKFGCQGLLGLHWRHRIVDANAGFQSRYSWDQTLNPESYYQAFAAAQVRAPRARKLAETLNQTDRGQRILHTINLPPKNNLDQVESYAGGAGYAFQFWRGYEPSAEVKESQAEIAQALRALTAEATSPEGRERLNYLTRHVEFLVPYSASWSLAVQLHQILDEALELRKLGKAEEARQLAMARGLPLWMRLAPLVREVFLDFQEIVSTRNDLGTLASIHNKYERLPLFQLRASMKEFLGDLPSEMENLYAEVRRPDTRSAPRVFIPTRPTVLGKGEKIRFFAIALGGKQPIGTALFARSAGEHDWVAIPMRLQGRRTFVGELEHRAAKGPLLDYYVEAELETEDGKVSVAAPREAPSRFYTLTLL